MKTNMTLCVVSQLIGLALGAMSAQAATIQFTQVTYANETEGFGFALQNDNSGWAVLQFTALTQPFGGYGTYTDFVGKQGDLVIVPPNTIVTQTFNAQQGTGAGQYTFLSGTPPGTSFSATLGLTYDVYSVDPNSQTFDPFGDYVTTSKISQTVNLAAPAATPEPSEWTLVAAGLALLVVSRSRRPSKG